MSWSAEVISPQIEYVKDAYQIGETVKVKLKCQVKITASASDRGFGVRFELKKGNTVLACAEDRVTLPPLVTSKTYNYSTTGYGGTGMEDFVAGPQVEGGLSGLSFVVKVSSEPPAFDTSCQEIV